LFVSKVFLEKLCLSVKLEGVAQQLTTRVVRRPEGARESRHGIYCRKSNQRREMAVVSKKKRKRGEKKRMRRKGR
jgi:hypothetical protein